MYGVLICVESLEGKEIEAEIFLETVLPSTFSSFLVRFEKLQYGLFGAFPEAEDRSAYLTGTALEKIRQQEGVLFAAPPEVHAPEILADKVPVASPERPDTKGIMLTFEAKEGHEEEVEELLKQARLLVQEEPDTTSWFAIKLGLGRYGIFDVFPGNGGRIRHLMGQVPRELLRHSMEMMGSIPDLDLISVLKEPQQ